MSDHELNRFISRRSAAVPEDRPGQARADELEAFWRRSEERHREKLRRTNGALWHAHHDHLAGVFRRMPEEHEAKAARLLEGAEG